MSVSIDSQGRLRGDAVGKLERASEQLVGGHHFLDKAYPIRFGSVELIGGEEIAQGIAPAAVRDPAKRRAPEREDAALDLDLTKARAFGG